VIVRLLVLEIRVDCGCENAEVLGLGVSFGITMNLRAFMVLIALPRGSSWSPGLAGMRVRSRLQNANVTIRCVASEITCFPNSLHSQCKVGDRGQMQIESGVLRIQIVPPIHKPGTLSSTRA